MIGYWNGERCEIKPIKYTVTEAKETPLHWQNAVVGSRRQGLKIKYMDQEWIIDNEHGDGHSKVTEGHGMWNAPSGHKSVSNPIDVEVIPETEMNTTFNKLGIRIERMEFDDWAKKHHPKEFEHLKKLRDSLTKRSF